MKPGVPPNDHFKMLMGICRSHKMAYKIERVKPRYFLTHMRNRGGLMLSPYNCHKNAVTILRAGADLSALKNAVCSEIPPQGPERQQQLQANLSLIKRSAGLIADMNNEERYLSLGCGHTVAFCKTAGVGGRTCETFLQNDDGTINVEKIKKSEDFNTMVFVGWDWEAVAWEVDVSFPEFSKIAQRALNTQNNSCTQVSELEAQITAADLMDDATVTCIDGWEQVAINAITDLALPCSSYISVLLNFVKQFGGGKGAPMVKFMDAFATQFGANAILGDTFWVAVTYTNFIDKTQKFGYCRVAMVLVNLQSLKIEDGIAKLITKTDVVKVASKNQLPLAQSCEKVLKEAMILHDAVVAGHGVRSTELIQPLGQIFTRVGLHLTKKEMMGTEKKEYTLDEIKSLFLAKVSAKAGANVSYTAWGSLSPATTNETPKPSTTVDDQPIQLLETIDEHSDPTFLARNRGYQVGTYVFEKGSQGVDAQIRVYKIICIAQDGVTIRQAFSYSGELHEGKVALFDLFTKWNVTTSSVPTVMQGHQQRPASFHVDEARCELWTVLQKAEVRSAFLDHLVFWRKPDQLRTSAKAIPAEKLTLYPVVPLSNISTKKPVDGYTLGSHDVGDDVMEFFLFAPPKPPRNEFEVDKSSVVTAFFWVGITHERKAANCEIRYKACKNDISIPIMVNHVQIPAFTQLLRYAPAPVNTDATKGTFTKAALLPASSQKRKRS